MPKIYFILFLICCGSLFAQDTEISNENSDSSFRPLRFSISTGIGFARFDNETDPDYDLNVGAVDFLLNYRITETLGVSTGVSFHSMTGNGFNNLGNFSKSRTDIKIPFLFNLGYVVSEKITVGLDFGVYARSILSDEERYLNFLLEDVYSGWGFGLQTSFSFMFEISNQLDTGISYNTLSDFSEFDTNNLSATDQSQRISSFNTLGIVVLYSF